MDPSTLLVLFIVGPAESGAATTQAAERALRQSVSSNVLVESVDPPSREDPPLERLCESEHASVIILVTWAHEHQDARLHVFRHDESRWIDRDIHFRSVDAPRERGRTIGFALASMMPDQALPNSSRANDAPSSGEVSSSSLRFDVSVGPRDDGALVVPADAARLIRGEAGVVPEPVGRTFRESRASVELLVRGVAGLGDRSAGGWGGSVAGRYQLSSAWGLRVAASARFDDVPAAGSSMSLLGAGAGVAWQSWTSPRRRVAIGARAMGLVMRQQFSHFDRDEPDVIRAISWGVGAELAADVSWRFTDTAALEAATGGEWAPGQVNLYLRDQKVTQVPNFRLFGEVGVRVFF